MPTRRPWRRIEPLEGARVTPAGRLGPPASVAYEPGVQLPASMPFRSASSSENVRSRRHVQFGRRVARRRVRGARGLPGELHLQPDAVAVAHAEQRLADLGRRVGVVAGAAGDGADHGNIDVSQFGSVRDQQVTVRERDDLPRDDDGAGRRAHAVADEEAVAGPGADDLVGERRAAVRQRALDAAVERAGGVDVALGDERVAVGRHAVLEHRRLGVDEAADVLGHVEGREGAAGDGGGRGRGEKRGEDQVGRFHGVGPFWRFRRGLRARLATRLALGRSASGAGRLSDAGAARRSAATARAIRSAATRAASK